MHRTLITKPTTSWYIQVYMDIKSNNIYILSTH